MQLWRKVGLVVECLTTDPKVVGTNSGDAKIGLHGLPQTRQWAQVLVHPGSKHREWLSFENLVRNRCKFNNFKPNAIYASWEI